MTNHEGLQVTGRAAATAAPDIVVVSLGVSVRGASAPEAIANASRAANALLAALRESGVEAHDIATARYGIHQEWRHVDGNSIPDGFRVVNTVNATVRDVGRAGHVIDAAAAAAGDVIEVQGIDYGLSDDSAVRAEARSAAWADALATARQLAELAGRRLGTVTSIRETVGSQIAPRANAMRAMAAETTPVSGGELSTLVELDVRFEWAD